MKNVDNFKIKNYIKLLILLSVVFFISCSSRVTKLPYLGNSIVKGKDTLFEKIRTFEFINQNSMIVTNKTFQNKIYVANFIFLSCPSICPKMTSELMNVYNIYRNNDDVLFLSHTIDPENDTLEKLKFYKESLGLNSHWHFVTGKSNEILSIAEKSYFTTAYKDIKAPGGYAHGGALLLVDRGGYIRGVYDGTNPIETERLIADIKILLIDLNS